MHPFLNLLGGRRMELLRQAEAAECGLACVGMVASYHGHTSDLATLRRSFPISLKGSTLKQVSEIAAHLGLGARALRCELDELKDLRTPAILHWDMDHFVVLERVRAGKLHLADPALGKRAVKSVGDQVYMSYGPLEERVTVTLTDLFGSLGFIGLAFNELPDGVLGQYSAVPPTINIDLNNIWGTVSDFDEFSFQVMQTILHELTHAHDMLDGHNLIGHQPGSPTVMMVTPSGSVPDMTDLESLNELLAKAAAAGVVPGGC